MDESTKSRIRELMLHVAPAPNNVLASCEMFEHDESEKFKTEFRSIIESMTEYPDVRQTVLDALDDLEATGWDKRFRAIARL